MKNYITFFEGKIIEEWDYWYEKPIAKTPDGSYTYLRTSQQWTTRIDGRGWRASLESVPKEYRAMLLLLT